MSENKEDKKMPQPFYGPFWLSWNMKQDGYK
jgi:hypothetical protein